ncbi:MAG TPA: peptide chain release factor N(5)-glutamine methyltransferase [Ktedonobacterales bacterium]
MAQRPTSDTGALRAARTWGEALWRATALLRAAPDASSPELDAELLLAHLMGVPRTSILAYPERALSPSQARRYAALVQRRAQGEPIAYLTGHREFMGLDFKTDRRALIPRPETELLVEAALADIRARLSQAPQVAPTVADIGTGTGAIAIALAAHEPRLPRVYAVDLAAEALALATENAARLRVSERVVLLRGDLLAALPEPCDVLVANLPYVAAEEAETLPRDVREYEPAQALFSAEEGLGHLRRFFAAAPAHARPRATILAEFGAGQAAAVRALAASAFPESEITIGSDYAGWERYATIRTSTPPSAPLR